MALYIGIRGDLNLSHHLIEFDERLIWSDLWNVFNTVPGERVKMLDFGSYMRYYLFEPNDAILRAEVETEVARIVDQDPRIVLDEVDIITDQERLTVNMNVTLTDIGTHLLHRGGGLFCGRRLFCNI